MVRGAAGCAWECEELMLKAGLFSRGVGLEWEADEELVLRAANRYWRVASFSTSALLPCNEAREAWRDGTFASADLGAPSCEGPAALRTADDTMGSCTPRLSRSARWPGLGDRAAPFVEVPDGTLNTPDLGFVGVCGAGDWRGGCSTESSPANHEFTLAREWT